MKNIQERHRMEHLQAEHPHMEHLQKERQETQLLGEHFLEYKRW